MVGKNRTNGFILGICGSFMVLALAAGTTAGQAPNPGFIQQAAIKQDMLLYSHTKYALYFLWPAFHIFVAWLMLESGFAARLRDWCQSASKNQLFSTGIFYAVFCLYVFAVSLPFSYASGFVLEHHYRLSSAPPDQWLFDGLKSLSLKILLGAPLCALCFFMARRFPKKWWLVLWATLCPLVIACTFLEPLLLEPAFNKFCPLAQGTLRTKVEKLASLSGISDQPTILMADKSKQTNKLNAYVSGIGSSTRIVFFDNILRTMPEDQLLSVTGHEIGHYVLKHIQLGLVLTLGGLLITLWLLKSFAGRLMELLPDQWGLKGFTDEAMIPVLAIIMSTAQILAAPITNGISRYMERQADEFSLALTRDRKAQTQSFITLAKTNLSDPSPPDWIEFWIFSHPSLAKRIGNSIEPDVCTDR